MIDPHYKLAAAALFPVIAATVIFLLDTRTRFSKLPHLWKSALIGLVFGALAVLGTEYGVPVNGATMNVRDASVLTAGLFFGVPAGLIAGFIGGVERWLCVYWGGGTFTRLACSLSTLLAGVYAAMLRKFMLDDRKPGWLLSFAIGVVMEVFHLTMIFLTNMRDTLRGIQVVQACAAPMILANGLSVLLTGVILSFLSGELKRGRQKNVRIAQTIQRWLLVAVSIAFILTSFFVLRLQSTISDRQTDTLLNLALEETGADIEDASDEHLLQIARAIRAEGENTDPSVFVSSLDAYAEKYGVAEISLIGSDGVIFASTAREYVDAGFRMDSGEQSKEFLCLLGDSDEYAQRYQPISFDSSVSRKYAGVKTDFGFLQAGYDADDFHADLSSTVKNATRNRHVGETGFILIVDGDYNVVSAPSWFRLESLKQNAREAPAEENTTFRLTLDGEKYFARYLTAEGFYIVSFLPQTEALRMRNIVLYVNTFMEILVFAILFGMIYQLIRRVVVNRIMSINRSLARITRGNLDEQVNVRSNAEFASLSDDINSTVTTLKRYIAEAAARIDEELEFARSIQLSALPGICPAFPQRKDFEIFASMEPAREVGGDFYDFYLTGENTLHFLVADVSGKGIPAAMFMMRAKTQLKSLTESGLPLREVFTESNRALCEGNEAGMFVTAWQCGIDLTTGNAVFANAGHNPPLLCRAGGKFEYLRVRRGLVLAGMDSIRYQEQSLTLEPGDTLFLYTDGVTEAADLANGLFGEQRLLDALNEERFEDMNALCAHVRRRVEEFVDGAEQFDDITMLAFRYEGPAHEV